MNILAVETSGLTASVALAIGKADVTERVLDTAGQRNARLLIPAIDELLQEHGLQPAEIDLVAVSVGPGSFTGLRVGLVCAKTFAWVNQAQLVAVDTLQALAQRTAGTAEQVTVISDAQRGDVFVNEYRCSGADTVPDPVGQVRIDSLTSVLEQLSADTLLTGPGVERFRDELAPSIRLAEDAMLQPRASALLPTARQLAAAGQLASVDDLEPVYLRRSYAEEKRDQTDS